MEGPMVGRRNALDRLVRAMVSRTRRPSIVVTGAAGVGKTRLLVEARTRAVAAGAEVHLAVATPATASIPFGPLAPFLPSGSAGGDLAAVLAAARAHLQGDGRRPVVLAVDDAHLLDAGSAALVQHLATAGTVAVVATVRSGDPAADALAPLWRCGLVDRLELSELDDDDAAQVITQAVGGPVDPGLLAVLTTLSGGNPLLLHELVGAGVAGGGIGRRHGVWCTTGPLLAPDSLPAMITRRLDRLDAGVRAGAELVALGEPVGAAVVEALLPAGTIAALEDERLIAPVPDRRRQQVRLVHPLYAEALRATVPPLRAREHRRRLADAVRATGMRRRGDRIQVAVWRLDAGRHEDPGLFLGAARDASAARDHALAARLAAVAVAAGGGVPAELVLIRQLPLLGRAEEAVRRLDALEAGASATDRVRLAQLRADLHLVRGEAAIADDVLAAAVRRATDPEEVDWLRVYQANQAFSRGDVDRSLRLGGSVLDRPAPDPVAVTLLATTRVRALCCAGRPLDGLDLADRALDLVDQPGAHEPRAAARAADLTMTRLQALPYAGRPLEALALGERRAGRCRAGDDPARLPYWSLDIAHVLRMVGRVGEARRAFRDMLGTTSTGALPTSHQLWGLDGLAETCALLGDADGAAAAVARLDAVLPAGFRALARTGTVWAVAAGGELSRAQDLAREHADRMDEVGALMQRAWLLHDAARLGATDVAADLADATARCQGELPGLWARNAAALAAHDPALLGETGAAFAARGFALWAAEAFAAAAAAHRQAGRPGPALAAQARAREQATLCPGVRTPLLALLDQPRILTPREHEIAGLAARGLSDKDIADRLHVSVRTVHTHLHQAYRKLGVGSRVDLAALLGPEPTATAR
ncbi:hypothetical protein H7X46_20100 [Pseudonocardia sp. C8]|uniref:helix-turn-helix transcriptional regulator n=1 Tax=Pseudonocardia sp. C8 TaxID=2762759 RepID=UPI001642CAD3|nr:LuxR family transcriptional regulator [Pseudonocardia sp. C8]MBC3193367.1 hypothetical protein [Pseudonocardia sp. C8]